MMQNSSRFFPIFYLFFFFGCSEKITVEELQVFAPTETFPNDTFLDTVTNKKAFIIVAHDDDDCAMSGTIAQLTRKGWKIKQLSLQSHVSSDTGENPAHIICEGNELILKDGYYRKGQDTIKTAYLPIPYNEIGEQYLTEKVAKKVIERVNQFKPSVIFTLDNEKGAYGNPDHVFISQLVKTLFEEEDLVVQKIYQSVYTDHMEREIIDKWLTQRLEKWGYPNASTMTNELYGINGMPEPTVQIDITEVAETKMEYLRAYGEDAKKNLRKFIPYFEAFDAQTYFGIFDREFFRVLEKEPVAAISGTVSQKFQ